MFSSLNLDAAENKQSTASSGASNGFLQRSQWDAGFRPSASNGSYAAAPYSLAGGSRRAGDDDASYEYDYERPNGALIPIQIKSKKNKKKALSAVGADHHELSEEEQMRPRGLRILGGIESRRCCSRCAEGSSHARTVPSPKFGPTPVALRPS